MSVSTINLTTFEWDAIVQGIQDGQCVLCIGPGLYSLEPEQENFTERLEAYLRENQDALRIRVQENGWFHLRPGGSDGPAYQAVRAFYQQAPEASIEALRKLARLRWHLLLSLNPDYHLRAAFEQQNLPHRFDAYVRNQPDRNTEKPTAEVPLVYNILGELGNRNSLVLTFDDFYDYLESVFKGNSMSAMLKNNILDAQYFLFIGMPFGQWFVHLFLRILRQHKERRTKFAAGQPLPPESLESCAEQYNINFVNVGITAFIDELYRRCEAKGLAKSPQAQQSAGGQNALFEQLTHWIVENEFKRVADRLKEVLRGVGEGGRPLLLRVLQLSGRHTDIEERVKLGIIGYEEQNIEMNKIRKDFLETVDDLKKMWGDLKIVI